MTLPALIAASAAALAAPSALAHPGNHHGAPLAVVAHWLTQPDHLALAALAAAVGWAAVRTLKKRRDRADR